MALLKYCSVVLLLSIFAQSAGAQDYHWHCTFSNVTYAVAFNPLSGGRVLFTSTPQSQNIFRSDDGGEHWHPSNPLDVPLLVVHQIFCLPSDTNIVFALTAGAFHSMAALYRSTDGGQNWVATPNLGGIDGEAIAYDPLTDALYYGENFAGIVFKSTNHGSSWMQVGKPNATVTLCTLGISPDANRVLLAGSEQGVIDLSTDEGMNWSVVYAADTVQNPEVPKIVFSSRATSVAFATRWHSAKESFVISRDRGLTWSSLASPDPHVWALELDQRQASCRTGTPLHLWTGLFTQNAVDTSAGGLIVESSDGALSWHSTGFPRIPIPPSVWVLKHDTASGTLAAATDSGVFIGHEPTASVERLSPRGSALLLYPNPATTMTTLSIPKNAGSALLCLSDVIGNVLIEKKLRGVSSCALDLKGLPGGVYFVRLTSLSGQSWQGHIVRYSQ